MSHRLHRSVLLALAYTFAPSLTMPAAAQSDTAFVLARAGVIPENIVYDAPRYRFLGGDLERDGMIELHRDGSIRPFAAGPESTVGFSASRSTRGGTCSGRGLHPPSRARR